MEAFGQSFLDVASTIGFASLLGAFALTIYRLIQGPSFADRVVARDMLMLIAIGFIAVAAVVTTEYNYIDAAIAMALVGFLATVAFARYIYRRALTLGTESTDEVEEVAEHGGAASNTGKGSRSQTHK